VRNFVGTSHRTHQTIDLSIDRIRETVELLSGDIGNPNMCRDLKTELESIDQTLFLTKHDTQAFKHTPLDRLLTNTVSPEIEQCSDVLWDILDKISFYQRRLQWFTVRWNGWGMEGLR
jgi:hypothetical protein